MIQTISASPSDGTAEAGAVSLYAPFDWFNLLADGNDETAACERCTELIELSYPHESVEVRKSFTDAMMFWRRVLLNQGVIMHGLVSVPSEEHGHAAWQVSAGVIDVPALNGEVNLSALMEKQVGHDLVGREVYIEEFSTEIGTGLGVISQPTLTPDAHFDLFPPRNGGIKNEDSSTDRDISQFPRIGMAVGVSCPPNGGKGILVIGNCMDPDQVLPMAAVVGAMAGRSFFVEE